MNQQPIKLPAGILKIKKGYNPNSSSIGTVLYSFPLLLAVLSGVLAAIVAFMKKERTKKVVQHSDDKQ